jgi:hypothetical protein
MTTPSTTGTRRGFLGRVGSALAGLLVAPAGLGLVGSGRAARADDTTLWRQLYMLRARGYGVNGAPLPAFAWTSTLRHKLRHDTTFRRQFYGTFGVPGAPAAYAAPAPAPGYGYGPPCGASYSYGPTYTYSYPQGGYPAPTGYATGQPVYGTPTHGHGAPTYAAPAYGTPTYAAPSYPASAPARVVVPPAPGAVPPPTSAPAPTSVPAAVPLPGGDLPPPLPRPYFGPSTWRGRVADVLALLEA